MFIVIVSFVPVEGGFVTATGKAEEFTVCFDGTVIAENVNSYTVKNGCVIFSKQDKEYAVSLSDLISGKINIQEYNGIGSVDISDIIKGSKSSLFEKFDVRSGEKKAEINFNPGDKVSHKKFGHGTIVSVTELGNDKKLTIEFETVGTKNLMAMFANLKKL